MLNNQEISSPLLIEDLGMLPINSIRKDTGNIAKKRFGIFKCPICDASFKALHTEIKHKRISECKKCYHKQKLKSYSKHGDSKNRLFGIWGGIKTRVFNKNRSEAKNYSLKGVGMFEPWVKSYLDFKNWAIENGYEDNLTIDRINNDGNYEPSNCRWVDRGVQARNKRCLSSKNTSGYRGVTKQSKSVKWASRITNNGVQINIGTYHDPKDAAMAYDTFVIVYGLQHTQNFSNMWKNCKT